MKLPGKKKSRITLCCGPPFVRGIPSASQFLGSGRASVYVLHWPRSIRPIPISSQEILPCTLIPSRYPNSSYPNLHRIFRSLLPRASESWAACPWLPPLARIFRPQTWKAKARGLPSALRSRSFFLKIGYRRLGWMNQQDRADQRDFNSEILPWTTHLSLAALSSDHYQEHLW